MSQTTATVATARAAAGVLVEQLHQTAEALASIATTDVEAAVQRVRHEAQALQARLLTARAAVAADLADVMACFAALTADLGAGLEAPAQTSTIVDKPAPEPTAPAPAIAAAAKCATVAHLPAEAGADLSQRPELVAQLLTAFGPGSKGADVEEVVTAADLAARGIAVPPALATPSKPKRTGKPRKAPTSPANAPGANGAAHAPA